MLPSTIDPIASPIVPERAYDETVARADAAEQPGERDHFPSFLDFALRATNAETSGVVEGVFRSAINRNRTGSVELTRLLLQQRELKLSDDDLQGVWSDLGVFPMLQAAPSRWLALDPLVFVVGAYGRLSGDYPTPLVAQALLEGILETGATPRTLIAKLAAEFGATPETTASLDMAIAPPERRGRWPWSKQEVVEPLFEPGRIANSLFVLRIARHLLSTGWGSAPMEWIFNSMRSAHRRG